LNELVFDHLSGRLSALDDEVVRHVPAGGNWKDLPLDFPSARVQQIRASAARGEGSRSTYYGRLAWDRPSYTISTYITRPGNGCFIHPIEPRLITVREAARLQTFPDSVRFYGTLRQRSMQIGNAVPPLLGYNLGAAIPAGTAADLFAGAGGLAMGLTWAGHDIVASADFDPHALRTLAGWAGADHPVLNSDLSDPEQFEQTMTAIEDRLAGRPLGILAGGPPCQGFSTAGPCRVDDPRNKLVLAFLNAIIRLNPERVLFENVPALRWRGKAFLDELVERLADLGYVAEVRILHAEAYGVPQLRRRLIVQASRVGHNVWPEPTHALSEPSFKNDQPGPLLSGPSASTVRDAIGDLPGRASESLDSPTPLNASKSLLSSWLRGDISLSDMLHAQRLEFAS
jgi:DNA (cytosine-5)-methyltransferase 1